MFKYHLQLIYVKFLSKTNILLNVLPHKMVLFQKSSFSHHMMVEMKHFVTKCL
jgi:urease accessory protein UreH